MFPIILHEHKIKKKQTDLPLTIIIGETQGWRK
jgi:hypothetical protein